MLPRPFPVGVDGSSVGSRGASGLPHPFPVHSVVEGFSSSGAGVVCRDPVKRGTTMVLTSGGASAAAVGVACPEASADGAGDSGAITTVNNLARSSSSMGTFADGGHGGGVGRRFVGCQSGGGPGIVAFAGDISGSAGTGDISRRSGVGRRS